jgi:hypothetical protein
MRHVANSRPATGGIPGSVLRRIPRAAAQRLSTAFHIFLVIPILIVLSAVSGYVVFSMPSRTFGVTYGHNRWSATS